MIQLTMAEKYTTKLPPGPTPSFLVGNLFDIDSVKPHLCLSDLSREYGEVFSFRVWGKTTVVISSLQAFKDINAEHGEDLLSRSPNFVTEHVYGGRDLPQCPNSSGFQARRAALYERTKKFGENHEAVLQTAVGRMLKFVEAKRSSPIDINEVIELYLSGIYLTNLTGEEYDYDDPRLRTLIERVDCVQVLLLPRVNGLMNMFPFLSYLPFGYGAIYKKSGALSARLKTMLFDPLKSSYDPDVTRGGIDCLIRAQKEADPDVAAELTDEYLWESAFSTIGAGTGVGIGYLVYFFVITLHHPGIAVNVRSEIDSVIGRDRLPTLADRAAMLYTQATLLELLRWVSPAPLLVPREATKDISFREYAIPKNTTVMTNAWHINHDEKVWENPWDFKPERFLGPDGKIRDDLRENVVAFGLGERYCFGDTLAMDTAFLFLTSMLQRFTFEVPEGSEPPPLDPHLSSPITNGVTPEPFKIEVKALPGCGNPNV